MLQQQFAGRNRHEDVVAEAERYPLMNDVWEDKIPRLDRITVPAYVVSSYSHTLHTQGTFRGWRGIASEDKWLRIHASLEWPDYYDEANVEDLRRFFDHYLKGEDNGWEETPRVRYSVLDLEGGAPWSWSITWACCPRARGLTGAVVVPPGSEWGAGREAHWLNCVEHIWSRCPHSTALIVARRA